MKAFQAAIRRKGEDASAAGGPEAMEAALRCVADAARDRAARRENIIDEAWAGLTGWRPDGSLARRPAVAVGELPRAVVRGRLHGGHSLLRRRTAVPRRTGEICMPGRSAPTPSWAAQATGTGRRHPA